MPTKFTFPDAVALSGAEFTVGHSLAFKKYAKDIMGFVYSDGLWRVEHNNICVATGKENCCAYAAREANEVGWRVRNAQANADQ